MVYVAAEVTDKGHTVASAPATHHASFALQPGPGTAPVLWTMWPVGD